MRCHDAHEWMSLKLDRRLPADLERELQAHLANCPACAEEWSTWQEIANLFEGAPLAEPPEDLAARVLLRLEARPHWSALLCSLLALLAGLVAISALFLAPWAQACSLALRVILTPGALGAISHAVADVVRPLALAAEAVRIAVRAVVTPKSALAALGYGAVLLAALAGWLRLVVLSPIRARSSAEFE